MTKKSTSIDLESRILGIFDSNIRAIQYSVYAVGVIGLAVIVKSAHVFSIFSNAKDVPREFISKAVKLQGRIDGIELVHLPDHNKISSSFFIVRVNIEHVPVVKLWRRRLTANHHPPPLLKIELLGVQPNVEGVNQQIRPLIQSNPIVWFQLYGVSEEENLLFASIFVKRAWWKIWSERDLSFIILKKKAGRVAPYLNSQHIYLNDRYPAYYRKLLFCEIKHRK